MRIDRQDTPTRYTNGLKPTEWPEIIPNIGRTPNGYAHGSRPMNWPGDHHGYLRRTLNRLFDGFLANIMEGSAIKVII
jgi:hypothetical protein